MTFEDIRLAVVRRMSTFTGIDPSRVQYPNPDELFKEPESGVWCRLNILGGTGFFAGMADRPHARRPGLIVIQCFDRVHVGTGAVTRLADALSEHFQFWSEGHLACYEASLIDAGQANGFIQFNVSIRYAAG